ncbi:hypothetical protein Q4Q35_04605 [Flavivirga aquimarina]|uniref:IPT/TIG domain-containing protein n=1 Tax=Flavivirga aquimarina TaxID=2027862 RepID=A0ABT8W7I8_9FLAO|nr:hypothetical protein [Flavivirga aquimarina]MDO5969081.1 hypothetical protein [Flavivirga aquimarina]
MKLFISSIFLCVLCLSCSNDKDESDNVMNIETLSNQNIETGGVILKGKIENVTGSFEYGFILTTLEGGTYNQNGRVEFVKGSVNGEFSREFITGLVEGQKYYFNVIALIDGDYFYGKEKLFISNGSALPLINEIIPEKACLKDTIVIKGKHFSKHPKIYFGDIAAFPFKESDSLIKIIVPKPVNNQLPTEPYTSIRVVNEDNEERISTKFSLHIPRIDSIIPRQITDSDTLRIYGAHFETEGISDLITTKFGEIRYAVNNVLEVKKNKIVLAPMSIRENNFELTLKSQLQEVVSKISVLMPQITGVSKSCVGFEEEFTVYGNNFPIQDDTWVSYRLGTAFASLLFKSKDSLKFKVTDHSEYSGFKNNMFEINFLDEKITSNHSICITEPWIKTSYTPIFRSVAHKQVTGTDILMLAYGGSGNQEGYKVFEFDIQNKDFVAIKTDDDMLHKYSIISSTLHNSILYSYRYFNPGSYFSSYNILTDEETLELAEFPGEDRQTNGLMVGVGEYIYYGLGNGYPEGPMNDIWRYSIKDNSWEKVLDNFPGIDTNERAIIYPLVFVISDKIYFGSGQIDNSILDFWEFDTKSNTLTQKSDLPNMNIKGIKPTIIGSKAYFQYEDMYEYDSINNVWRTIETNGETYSRTGFFNDGSEIYMLHNRYIYKFNSDYLN